MNPPQAHTRQAISGGKPTNKMRRAGIMDLTLPDALIWTVPVTPIEEQLPQPTRAPLHSIPILKCAPWISALPPPALTCAAWMCVRSRVLVVDCATSAALRERRGNQAAADAFVASHFPTAPPEILEQRVMMSIPNIYNPNFNGMESTPFFVPQPNEIVGFRCASRLPLPGCSSTSPRCVRRPHPISTPRGFVSSASLLNSQLQGRRDRRFGHLFNRLPGSAHRRPEPARRAQVPEERKGDDGCRAGRGPGSISDPAA